MTIQITRLSAGQTRYGVFHNFDSPIDRRALGAWYCAIHFAPFYVWLSGEVRS